MAFFPFCLVIAWALELTCAVPVEYWPGDNITVMVAPMTSVETAIPYDYYSLMVCQPQDVGPRRAMQEMLPGVSLQPTSFFMQVGRDINCATVCTTVPETGSLAALKDRIDSKYRGHFVLDNLPVAEVLSRRGRKKLYHKFYRHGCPIGAPSTGGSVTSVYNHLAFTVKYHASKGVPKWRIVGFEVVPHSIDSAVIDRRCPPGLGFTANRYRPQTVIASAGPHGNATAFLSWSYSVRWQEDAASAWRCRWEEYFETEVDSSIHRFSIVNSLLIALFLTAMVAVIVARAVRKDMRRYNHPRNADIVQEQIGWKVVHADAFRTPPHAGLLSCYVATGVQLLATGFVLLVLACLGIVPPTCQGYELSLSALGVYTCAGPLGGWVATTMADMFQKNTWRTVLMTGTWFPGHVLMVLCGSNVLLWAKQASTSVAFTLSLYLVASWLCIHLPLVFLGGRLGQGRVVLRPPQSVGNIPRFIPSQRWYVRPPFMLLVAGILPFGAVFVQIFFILKSVWQEQFYCVFGMTLAVCFILIITCAEISIVMVYLQLVYEDYRWWWRAFLCSGSSGVYLFMYSLHFLNSSMNMPNLASRALYISYMAIVSYGFFLVTGTVGFISSLVFVRGIFSAIHVDDD